MRSVERDVVRVDEPTPILQVKSADAAECKVHRCITRSRASDVSFATRGEGEENIYTKCAAKHAYISFFFFFALAVNNYSAGRIVDLRDRSDGKIASPFVHSVVSTLLN